MIFYKKLLILISFATTATTSVYGDFSGKTYFVVEKCKSSNLDICQPNYLRNKTNYQKLIELNDIDYTNEFYLKFDNNVKGSVYYTYSADGSIDQEWREFSYKIMKDKLQINIYKNAYVIDSLLNKDKSQPFLDRKPFSYINKKAKIIGFGDKEQPIEYDTNKIVSLSLFKNNLVLNCLEYLKNNHYESPITKLCSNKSSYLILKEIK